MTKTYRIQFQGDRPMTKITPKQAQQIIEIADKLLSDYDLSEISKEDYYKEVANRFNKQNL